MKRRMIAALLAFLTVQWTNAQAPPTPCAALSSQTEKNKAIARRVFDEILNQGNFDAANEIYAPDFVNHGLHRDASLAEDQAAARWEKGAAPDLHLSVELMVAECDLVSVVWIARGTNSHAAGWLPATGTRLEVRGATTWRFVNGKICEEWSSFDMLRIARQVVGHLKWWLLGAFCIVLVVVGAACGLLRRLLFRRTLASAGGAAL